jgi:low affinity Fe/Cu permease
MATRSKRSTSDAEAPAHSSADWFRRFAMSASYLLGTHWAFLAAVAVILIWAVTGPLFHFSDAWQLVINTGTTIVTFLMVFLIQTTQNRDSRAIHLKLDELIRSSKARNVFADLENATEEELQVFQQEFARLRGEGLASSAAAQRARDRIHQRRSKG